ncbi:MAG: LOG family protein, partial [Candidatus Omnitrophica bacterium]|nr:LOG family protein [Candidatus Omnitrophota bacterium]
RYKDFLASLNLTSEDIPLLPSKLRQEFHKLEGINTEIGNIILVTLEVGDAILGMEQIVRPATGSLFQASLPFKEAGVDKRFEKIIVSIERSITLLRLESAREDIKKYRIRPALEECKEALSRGETSVIKELNSIKRDLRERLNNLKEQRQRIEGVARDMLRRHREKIAAPRIVITGSRSSERVSLSLVDKAFEDWAAAEERISLTDKIIKYYGILNDYNIRSPPGVGHIKVILSDPIVNESADLILESEPAFESLSALQRSKTINKIISEHNISGKDRRLLHLVSFTPFGYYFLKSVPPPVREALTSHIQELFGAMLFITKKRLEIRYAGDGTKYGNYLMACGLSENKLWELTTDDLGRPLYWMPEGKGGKKILADWFKRQAGESKKYYLELFEDSKEFRRHLAIYESYSRLAILHNKILSLDRQIYLVNYETLSGDKAAISIVLEKSKSSSPIENKYHQKKIDREFLTAIAKELKQYQGVFNKIGPAVSIFGSARVKESDLCFKQARKIASLLSREGFSIITGGGPGIMMAANSGARPGRFSVGLNIEIPGEQNINNSVGIGLLFKYFFIRKLTFIKLSQFFICMQGGFGTLDELFEILYLKDNGIIAGAPVILFGKKFYKNLVNLLKNMEERGIFHKPLKELIYLADSYEEILKLVKRNYVYIDWNQHKLDNVRAIRDLYKSLDKLSGFEVAAGILGEESYLAQEDEYHRIKSLSRILTDMGVNMICLSRGVSDILRAGRKDSGNNKNKLNSRVISLFTNKPAALNSRQEDNVVLGFRYNFERKIALVKHARLGLIFFSGGINNLDLLLEILCMIQTGKLRPIPVVLVGRKLWRGWDNWFKGALLPARTISDRDLNIYTIVDTTEEAAAIVEEFYYTGLIPYQKPPSSNGISSSPTTNPQDPIKPGIRETPRILMNSGNILPDSRKVISYEHRNAAYSRMNYFRSQGNGGPRLAFSQIGSLIFADFKDYNLLGNEDKSKVRHLAILLNEMHAADISRFEIYNTPVIISLMHKFLENCIVLDMGTGDGVLMLAAHKLGAPVVWGVELFKYKIKKAKENFLLNQMVPEKDYFLEKGDIKDRDFIKHLAGKINIFANDNHYGLAVVFNIGQWEDCSISNLDILNLLHYFSPVKIVIGGGHFVTSPKEGRNFNNEVQRARNIKAWHNIDLTSIRTEKGNILSCWSAEDLADFTPASFLNTASSSVLIKVSSPQNALDLSQDPSFRRMLVLFEKLRSASGKEHAELLDVDWKDYLEVLESVYQLSPLAKDEEFKEIPRLIYGFCKKIEPIFNVSDFTIMLLSKIVELNLKTTFNFKYLSPLFQKIAISRLDYDPYLRWFIVSLPDKGAKKAFTIAVLSVAELIDFAAKQWGLQVEELKRSYKMSESSAKKEAGLGEFFLRVAELSLIIHCNGAIAVVNNLLSQFMLLQGGIADPSTRHFARLIKNNTLPAHMLKHIEIINIYASCLQQNNLLPSELMYYPESALKSASSPIRVIELVSPKLTPIQPRAPNEEEKSGSSSGITLKKTALIALTLFLFSATTFAAPAQAYHLARSAAPFLILSDQEEGDYNIWFRRAEMLLKQGDKMSASRAYMKGFLIKGALVDIPSMFETTRIQSRIYIMLAGYLKEVVLFEFADFAQAPEAIKAIQVYADNLRSLAKKKPLVRPSLPELQKMLFALAEQIPFNPQQTGPSSSPITKEVFPGPLFMTSAKNRLYKRTDGDFICGKSTGFWKIIDPFENIFTTCTCNIFIDKDGSIFVAHNKLFPIGRQDAFNLIEDWQLYLAGANNKVLCGTTTALIVNQHLTDPAAYSFRKAFCSKGMPTGKIFKDPVPRSHKVRTVGIFIWPEDSLVETAYATSSWFGECDIFEVHQYDLKAGFVNPAVYHLKGLSSSPIYAKKNKNAAERERKAFEKKRRKARSHFVSAAIGILKDRAGSVNLFQKKALRMVLSFTGTDEGSEQKFNNLVAAGLMSAQDKEVILGITAEGKKEAEIKAERFNILKLYHSVIEQIAVMEPEIPASDILRVLSSGYTYAVIKEVASIRAKGVSGLIRSFHWQNRNRVLLLKIISGEFLKEKQIKMNNGSKAVIYYLGAVFDFTFPPNSAYYRDLLNKKFTFRATASEIVISNKASKEEWVFKIKDGVIYDLRGAPIEGTSLTRKPGRIKPYITLWRYILAKEEVFQIDKETTGKNSAIIHYLSAEFALWFPEGSIYRRDLLSGKFIFRATAREVVISNKASKEKWVFKIKDGTLYDLENKPLAVVDFTKSRVQPYIRIWIPIWKNYIHNLALRMREEFLFKDENTLLKEMDNIYKGWGMAYPGKNSRMELFRYIAGISGIPGLQKISRESPSDIQIKEAFKWYFAGDKLNAGLLSIGADLKNRLHLKEISNFLRINFPNMMHGFNRGSPISLNTGDYVDYAISEIKSKGHMGKTVLTIFLYSALRGCGDIRKALKVLVDQGIAINHIDVQKMQAEGWLKKEDIIRNTRQFRNVPAGEKKTPLAPQTRNNNAIAEAKARIARRHLEIKEAVRELLQNRIPPEEVFEILLSKFPPIYGNLIEKTIKVTAQYSELEAGEEGDISSSEEALDLFEIVADSGKGFFGSASSAVLDDNLLSPELTANAPLAVSSPLLFKYSREIIKSLFVITRSILDPRVSNTSFINTFGRLKWLILFIDELKSRLIRGPIRFLLGNIWTRIILMPIIGVLGWAQNTIIWAEDAQGRIARFQLKQTVYDRKGKPLTIRRLNQRMGALYIKTPEYGYHFELLSTDVSHRPPKRNTRGNNKLKKQASSPLNTKRNDLFDYYPLGFEDDIGEFKGWFFPLGSLFQDRRIWDLSPGLAGYLIRDRPHTGLDWAYYLNNDKALAIPGDTKIVAISNGRVVMVDYKNDLVVIEHKGIALVTYGHIEPGRGVKEGGRVKGGEVIGSLSAALINGPLHLHLMTDRITGKKRNGESRIIPDDPAKFKGIWNLWQAGEMHLAHYGRVEGKSLFIPQESWQQKGENIVYRVSSASSPIEIDAQSHKRVAGLAERLADVLAARDFPLATNRCKELLGILNNSYDAGNYKEAADVILFFVVTGDPYQSPQHIFSKGRLNAAQWRGILDIIDSELMARPQNIFLFLEKAMLLEACLQAGFFGYYQRGMVDIERICNMGCDDASLVSTKWLIAMLAVKRYITNDIFILAGGSVATCLFRTFRDLIDYRIRQEKALTIVFIAQEATNLYLDEEPFLSQIWQYQGFLAGRKIAFWGYNFISRTIFGQYAGDPRIILLITKGPKDVLELISAGGDILSIVCKDVPRLVARMSPNGSSPIKD